MNCLLGYNGIVFDRPIFSIGHFFKALMFRAWSSPREFARLLSPRQRLQICLGDSNMAEEAEYLRVGTTMLVLGCHRSRLLAQSAFGFPPHQNPPHLLCRSVSRSESPLQRRRPAVGFGHSTNYYEACAAFVAESPDATDEARDIFSRWGEVLALLETNPDALGGPIGLDHQTVSVGANVGG